MEFVVQMLRTDLRESGVVANPAQSAASCGGRSAFQIVVPSLWTAGSELVNVS